MLRLFNFPKGARGMGNETTASQLSWDALVEKGAVEVGKSKEQETTIRDLSNHLETQKPNKDLKATVQPPRQKTEEPPMLRHYKELKVQYPEHLLLYQVGDFYEVFYGDASIVADVLNIRLTSRNKEQPNPVPMCGVPIHAIDNYLPKLITAGHSVILMSQVEDAKSAKGTVRREISRIITPGVRFEGDGLEEKRFNFLVAAILEPSGDGAMCYTDVSTGMVRVQVVASQDELIDSIQRIRPSEVIIPSLLDGKPVVSETPWLRALTQTAVDLGAVVVKRPFEVISEKAFLDGPVQACASKHDKESETSLSRLSPVARTAVSAVFRYVAEVSFDAMPLLGEIEFEESQNATVIDAATRRNLELFESRIDGDKRSSLLYNIDYSKTAMGSRLLAEWLISPSTELKTITERQDAIGELVSNSEVLEEIRGHLVGVRDIDRLVSRITGGRANPRDLATVKESLESLPRVYEILNQRNAPLWKQLSKAFDVLSDISEKLSGFLTDAPPTKLNEGGIIKEGFHPEVDRLRHIRSDGKEMLAELESKERARTGISGLKVKYNNVFGYFIEITKTHLAKVPPDYQRKQTLANAERFVTDELKEFEVTLLSAKAKLIDLEKELFIELRNWVSTHASRMHRTSRVLSIVDVLSSLAHLARQHNFARPEISEGYDCNIQGGRHPVVERVIGAHNFIANDVVLNASERRFAVLTGPNMGGKSTYLRQLGLIQLLAQIGSFVPAASATLGIVDRIFTRIGAADDLARGDSTFMVEMREATSIIRKATSRSLVLIDEIGRGTATTDGLAIATAMAEWLLDNSGCKTVFATHFHELAEFAESKDGAFCLSVGVLEKDKEITFTHRIEEHAADRSYGVEVARLAGLPEPLVERAEELLESFETAADARATLTPKSQEKVRSKPAEKIPRWAEQVIEKLRTIDPNSLTPRDALTVIYELHQRTNENTKT